MESTASAALIASIVAVVLAALGLVGGVIGYVQGTAALRRATLLRQRATAAEETALQARTQAEQSARTVQQVLDRLNALQVRSLGDVADLPTGPLMLPPRSAPAPFVEEPRPTAVQAAPLPREEPVSAPVPTAAPAAPPAASTPAAAAPTPTPTLTPAAVSTPAPTATPTPTPTPPVPTPAAGPEAAAPVPAAPATAVAATPSPEPQAASPAAAATEPQTAAPAPAPPAPVPSPAPTPESPAPAAASAAAPEPAPAAEGPDGAEQPGDLPTDDVSPEPGGEPEPAPASRAATGQITAGGQEAPPMDWSEALRTGSIPLPAVSRRSYSAPTQRPQPSGTGPARFALRAVGRQRYEAVNLGGTTAEQAVVEGMGDDRHLVSPVRTRPTAVAAGEALPFSVLRVEGRTISVRVTWLRDGGAEESVVLPLP